MSYTPGATPCGPAWGAGAGPGSWLEGAEKAAQPSLAAPTPGPGQFCYSIWCWEQSAGVGSFLSSRGRGSAGPFWGMWGLGGAGTAAALCLGSGCRAAHHICASASSLCTVRCFPLCCMCFSVPCSAVLGEKERPPLRGCCGASGSVAGSYRVQHAAICILESSRVAAPAGPPPAHPTVRRSQEGALTLPCSCSQAAPGT